MLPISVLVPTASRPAMLRTALRSIAEQTALAEVGEVVVIENLGNRNSEKVCQEFPQLPIRYIFRDPPIPPGILSSRDAMSRIRCDRMAILFDDDWWMGQHLENAIKSFEQNPEAIASYAVCLWTSGEGGYLDGTYGSFLPWFGASKPIVGHRWELNFADLLVISHINCTFHYSSLVVNTDVFRRSIECVANGNPFDTDRLIPVELGRHGMVIYDSRPQVYIRFHGGREAERLAATGEGKYWWQKSTEQLSELAKEMHIDLKREFAERMQAKSVTAAALQRHFNPACLALLVTREILNVPQNVPPKVPAKVKVQHSRLKAICREITPPVIWKMLGRLKRAGPRSKPK